MNEPLGHPLEYNVGDWVGTEISPRGRDDGQVTAEVWALEYRSWICSFEGVVWGYLE